MPIYYRISASKTVLLYKYSISAFIFCLLFVSCSSSKVILPEYEVQRGLIPVSEEELQLITYNVKAVNEKPTEETAALIDYLTTVPFDVVCLQEVFSEQTRQSLVTALGPHYASTMARVDYSHWWQSLWQDAGLMILSKFPAVDVSSLDFGKGIKNKGTYFHKILNKQLSITLDAFANKSIAGTLLRKDNDSYLLVYNTHVQAFGTGDHKLKQLTEIYEFIKATTAAIVESQNVDPQKLSVMLTGDFNIDAYADLDKAKMLTALGNPLDIYTEAKPKAQEKTFVAGIFGILFRFDYIFTWSQIGDIQVNPLQSIQVEISDVKVEGESISDHYPVIARVK